MPKLVLLGSRLPLLSSFRVLPPQRCAPVVPVPRVSWVPHHRTGCIRVSCREPYSFACSRQRSPISFLLLHSQFFLKTQPPYSRNQWSESLGLALRNILAHELASPPALRPASRFAARAWRCSRGLFAHSRVAFLRRHVGTLHSGAKCLQVPLPRGSPQHGLAPRATLGETVAIPPKRETMSLQSLPLYPGFVILLSSSVRGRARSPPVGNSASRFQTRGLLQISSSPEPSSLFRRAPTRLIAATLRTFSAAPTMAPSASSPLGSSALRTGRPRGEMASSSPPAPRADLGGHRCAPPGISGCESLRDLRAVVAWGEGAAVGRRA